MNELWLYHQLGLEGADASELACVIPYPKINYLMEFDPTHTNEDEVEWPVYDEAKGG